MTKFLDLNIGYEKKYASEALKKKRFELVMTYIQMTNTGLYDETILMDGLPQPNKTLLGFPKKYIRYYANNNIVLSYLNYKLNKVIQTSDETPLPFLLSCGVAPLLIGIGLKNKHQYLEESYSIISNFKENYMQLNSDDLQTLYIHNICRYHFQHFTFDFYSLLKYQQELIKQEKESNITNSLLYEKFIFLENELNELIVTIEKNELIKYF
uniref:Uncharacterized protein n=1 Tax=Cavenderia fasciculata TaxID=261658 RepID=B2XX87_CACFS|nr:hypothetical protein Difao_mp25 [Cavenderia fasciculata]ABX45209.1 hypothetical protein [Cavenderia fasciculata]